jgi:hypothetical protein
MPDAVPIDAVGRRRSKITLPGYLARRAPHNKGMSYLPRSLTQRQRGHLRLATS